MAKQFAIRLSLIAFSVLSLRGLMDGSDFVGTVQAALVASGIFFGFGYFIGEMARRLVEESAEADFERAKQASTQTTTHD